MSLEENIRGELKALLAETSAMALLVRLAWHDSGTYEAKSKTGGANGSIRFQPEIGHGANAGLSKAVEMMEPIKQKYSEISYADLYQLASVVSIEYAGGPVIPFRLGRVDVVAESCTADGRLPDATKKMDHLRDVFYRMGLTDKDIVLLSGAHTLGAAHKDRSGFEGAWTQEPVKFDNSYFVEILKESPDPKLLRLVSDLALLDEPSTKEMVEAYAKDQALFFADYSVAHQKLSELGCSF